MDPVAVCRLCVVEIVQGQARARCRPSASYLPACQHRRGRTPWKVATRADLERKSPQDRQARSPRLLHGRPPHPLREADASPAIASWRLMAKQFDVGEPRFERRAPRSASATTRRWSSPWITTPASSATAASARATTSSDNQVIGRDEQGLPVEDRLRPGRPRWATRRAWLVRRVHDLLPHRRAHGQGGRASSKTLGGTEPPARTWSTPEELIRHPIADIRRSFRGAHPGVPPLERERGRSSAAVFKKGDLICREGEFGATAFLHRDRRGGDLPQLVA